jgi:hypothetical protein
LKDILTTGIGMVIFGDVQYSFYNGLGLGLGLLGGMAYSIISYREQSKVYHSHNKKSDDLEEG